MCIENEMIQFSCLSESFAREHTNVPLTFSHEKGLKDTFSNVGLHFVCISFSWYNCSSERSFLKLKLIKNRLKNVNVRRQTCCFDSTEYLKWHITWVKIWRHNWWLCKSKGAQSLCKCSLRLNVTSTCLLCYVDCQI
jgi:hypothetical protein